MFWKSKTNLCEWDFKIQGGITMKRLLILEDGSVYEGVGFGGDNFKIGELIFQTGMSGYQEVISDMSYYGQIVMMTYPSIGNVGINRDDFESMNPQLFGFIVKEYCEYPSNFRSEMTIDEYMKLKDIPGIADVDTRAITRKIRDKGVMKAAMANEGADIEKIIEKLRESEAPTDGVKQVSAIKPYAIPNRGGYKVVLLDLGAKYALIRELNARGCDIVAMPYNANIDDIMALKPDGVIISSGPGIPGYIEETVESVRKLSEKIAIFGIGLGNQVIAKAFGGKVEAMKFGHHGNSTPIVNLAKNKVEFTAQNHRFHVDEKSLEKTGLVVTHRALNDGSVEGFQHKTLPVMGVQFNPEAAPGADDTMYVFDRFVEMLDKGVK